MTMHYVYTVERDAENGPDQRPIVWEQYLDQGAADFEAVRDRANSHGDRYGRVRIARLAYIDEDADLMGALDSIANMYDDEMATFELASAMYEAHRIALAALAKLKEEK